MRPYGERLLGDRLAGLRRRRKWRDLPASEWDAMKRAPRKAERQRARREIASELP